MIKCLLHGSLRKDFDLIKNVHNFFTNNGIEVVAPKMSEIVGIEEGFVKMNSDPSLDKRITEIIYLQNISKLGSNGFSYYVNPRGRVGLSCAYELAFDQLTDTRTIFMEQLKDLPIYVPQNSVFEPDKLVDYIHEYGNYPAPIIPKNEIKIHKMIQGMLLPNSLIAVGAIIEYNSKKCRKGQERDCMFVRTHKWPDPKTGENRWSIVGGKVRRGERLGSALEREVLEETGLKGQIGEHIETFDEIKTGGYYINGILRVFHDRKVYVDSKKVKLNDEAEEYAWMPCSEALKNLNFEPNARKIVELVA